VREATLGYVLQSLRDKEKPMPARNEWIRDQLRVALRLYMRTPFGRLHGKNPDIIALAKTIGRP
jgi:hypothetical protein